MSICGVFIYAHMILMQEYLFMLEKYVGNKIDETSKGATVIYAERKKKNKYAIFAWKIMRFPL